MSGSEYSLWKRYNKGCKYFFRGWKSLIYRRDRVNNPFFPHNFGFTCCMDTVGATIFVLF